MQVWVLPGCRFHVWSWMILIFNFPLSKAAAIYILIQALLFFFFFCEPFCALKYFCVWSQTPSFLSDLYVGSVNAHYLWGFIPSVALHSSPVFIKGKQTVMAAATATRGQFVWARPLRWYRGLPGSVNVCWELLAQQHYCQSWKIFFFFWLWILELNHLIMFSSFCEQESLVIEAGI